MKDPTYHLYLDSHERKIIIPRNHGENAVFLIEIVVVYHAAGVAVAILDEIVRHKIFDDTFHINNIFNISRLFNRRSKMHDAKCAHHIERKNDIRSHSQNHDCRYHRQSHKREGKARGIHNSGILAGDSSAYLGMALLAAGGIITYVSANLIFIKKDIPV